MGDVHVIQYLESKCQQYEMYVLAKTILNGCSNVNHNKIILL
jgi:hypothetical protein